MDTPYYELAGVRYPRITRILSVMREPELDAWRKTVGAEAAEDISGAAIRTGKTVHSLIEETLKTGKLAKTTTTSEDVRMAWGAWQKWYALQPPMPSNVAVEYRAITTEYGYGCTADLVEPLRITDWKITGAIRPKHWIQLHAEVPAVFQAPELWPQVCVRIVRLDKRLGEFQEKEVPFSRAIWCGFLHARALYMAFYGQELNEEIDNVSK